MVLSTFYKIPYNIYYFTCCLTWLSALFLCVLLLFLIISVDHKFDESDIPYDVLWLDIEHTDGKKYFTWDSARFPHPKNMQDKLAVKGRKVRWQNTRMHMCLTQQLFFFFTWEEILWNFWGAFML